MRISDPIVFQTLEANVRKTNAKINKFNISENTRFQSVTHQRQSSVGVNFINKNLSKNHKVSSFKINNIVTTARKEVKGDSRNEKTKGNDSSVAYGLEFAQEGREGKK